MEGRQTWFGKLLAPAGRPEIFWGGLIALVLSLYFYLLTEKVGRLSFVVEQVQVFDRGRVSTSWKSPICL